MTIKKIEKKMSTILRRSSRLAFRKTIDQEKIEQITIETKLKPNKLIIYLYKEFIKELNFKILKNLSTKAKKNNICTIIISISNMLIDYLKLNLKLNGRYKKEPAEFLIRNNSIAFDRQTTLYDKAEVGLPKMKFSNGKKLKLFDSGEIKRSLPTISFKFLKLNRKIN